MGSGEMETLGSPINPTTNMADYGREYQTNVRKGRRIASTCGGWFQQSQNKSWIWRLCAN